MKLGKRKRAPLVKCGGGDLGSSISSPLYEKSFCLCISRINESLNPRKWYMLNLSSKDDKEEEEKNATWLLHIPSAEHRGSHLAFHHNKRHRGEKPLVLPLITELEFKDKHRFGSRIGTRCAVMGSKIFRIGGTYALCLSEPWSRKVTYFDVSHPKEGWKSGPRTNCGRADAAVVALDGKLYVFGGCHPDIPGGFFAEFLDTTTSAEEKGEVNGGWHHLQPEPPQSLGFKELFAAALDGGEYSGKILVGSKITGVVCLYDVEHKLWENLDLKVEYGKFISNPVVVGTSIYWIKLGSKKLCAYDFVQRQMFSVRVGDFKICQNLGLFKRYQYVMCPTLLHLAGDLFSILWVDSKLLHCTKLRFSTTNVMDASVLCCHSYHFDRSLSLVDCLPVQPSLL